VFARFTGRTSLIAGVTAELRSATALPDRGEEQWAALLAAWVCAALVIVFPILVIRYTPIPAATTWRGLLVVTTISGLRYSWIVGAGIRRPYEMSFWVFTYVFLGLAPLAQLRMEQIPDTTPRVDPALNGAAIVIVVIGITSFAVGLALARTGGILGPRTTRAFAPAAAIAPRRALLLAAFALLADAYYIGKVGIGTLLSSRVELYDAVAANWQDPISAVVSAVAAMSVLIAFVALVKVADQQPRRDWGLVAVIVIVGVVLALTLNPITNARYTFGTAALAVAALFGLLATRTRFRLTAMSAVVALILVFPLLDAFRYSTQGEFKSTSPLASFTSPDYDAFAQINNTKLYTDRSGLTYGRQALGVVLFWVPRKLWANKPTDTGVLLANSRHYPFTNLSAPLWSELFVNGGWPLLVIGMFGLGVIARRQDERIELTLQRARAPGVLACILPFYLIILLRGSLLQAMSNLLVILVCSLFVLRRTGREAPDGPA
jgi:O-antigen polysaccharide polymerase Wzy